jgi:molecular chaperone GrpE
VDDAADATMEGLTEAPAAGIDESLKAEQAKRITLLSDEVEEAKDRIQWLLAETENYRKRVARQIEDERRYANLPMIRDLLPVLDNLDRAIEAAENTKHTTGLLEGCKMVVQQLQDVLARHGCREIEALHEPFDPYHHEAVSQQPSEDFPANTVLNVVQAGFQLHDRVVRPSQVIVSTETE